MITTEHHAVLRPAQGVAKLARPSWAPSLVTVFVGQDALAWLTTEFTRQKELATRYGDMWAPTLALPPDIDPADLTWPVRGHNARIVGDVALPVLLRLAQALLRDGAEIVAGIHEGELFLAKNGEVRHAA